jgi:hypothetical protein
MMPSRTERLAYWRDEYALQSFTDLQRLLAFMLSHSPQGSQMRLWLTVSATVLYAGPFKQRPEVKLAEDEVPIKYRAAHNEVLLHRDKVIAHRDPDAHKKGVGETSCRSSQKEIISSFQRRGPRWTMA